MNSTLDIRAPEEQTEGTRSQVLRWLKAIGDEVSEHEPLIELETDKVTVEIAAPASGVLREIVKGEQEEIAPGDVLGRIEVAGLAAAAGGDGTDAGSESTGGNGVSVGEPSVPHVAPSVPSPSHAAKSRDSEA
ncbi:MAG: biotin/lipoyl-containing protein, partial [Gammaproteobacteria bacterium]